MSRVSVLNLTKRFGATISVDGIEFVAEEGALTTLLGPSGCGKTTTLRMVAGLETPDKGEIWLGDTLVAAPAKGASQPPEKRQIGMVFQSYAIWPHMTAFDNVAYPLRARRVPRDRIKTMASRMFDLLQLQGLEGRYPGQLSGGQQQRVALARALVYEPKMLLLDEPLANLDAKVREAVRFELKELQRRLNFTAIYVTHDQTEAMALSDKIIVMDQGRIVQKGTPAQVYDRPANRFVAEFVGQTNIIAGRLRGGGLIELDEGYAITQPEGAATEERDIAVCVRPENLCLTPTATAPGIRGHVTAKAFLGNLLVYRVAARGAELQVQVDPASDPQCGEGDPVVLTVRGNRVHVLNEQL